jgi:hypothetical protein
MPKKNEEKADKPEITTATPPEPFPTAEPVPAVKNPLTNTVTKTVERVKVKSLETGDEHIMHPVDGREAVATGRYEYVLDDVPEQMPSDKIPTIVTGVTNAIMESAGQGEEDEKSSSKKK